MTGEFPQIWQFRTHELTLIIQNYYGCYECKNCFMKGFFRIEEVLGEEGVLGIFNLPCAEIIMESVLK